MPARCLEGAAKRPCAAVNGFSRRRKVAPPFLADDARRTERERASPERTDGDVGQADVAGAARLPSPHLGVGTCSAGDRGRRLDNRGGKADDLTSAA